MSSAVDIPEIGGGQVVEAAHKATGGGFRYCWTPFNICIFRLNQLGLPGGDVFLLGEASRTPSSEDEGVCAGSGAVPGMYRALDKKDAVCSGFGSVGFLGSKGIFPRYNGRYDHPDKTKDGNLNQQWILGTTFRMSISSRQRVKISVDEDRKREEAYCCRMPTRAFSHVLDAKAARRDKDVMYT